MMDFYDHPDFVHELLHTIADYNIAQVKEAMKYDIDAVYFGDDWGQQRGLQMWAGKYEVSLSIRSYAECMEVRNRRGKYVFIHSCGDVDELFDDLIEIVDCFNPFQPEVMNIFQLIEQYRDCLSFHGGLSTQQTLPYGTPQDVVRETRRLIDKGRPGGYILALAHDVEGMFLFPTCWLY